MLFQNCNEFRKDELNVLCSDGTLESFSVKVKPIGTDDINAKTEKVNGSRKGNIFRFLFSAFQKMMTRKVRNRIAPKKTILFVDDEDELCFVTKLFFEKMDFQVFTANSGEEAVNIYSDHKNEISCVLLDMSMPGMDGVETVKELNLIKNGLNVPVIVSSGYNEDVIAERFTGQNISGFVQKPYSMKGLLEKVTDMMSCANSPLSITV